jgi:acetyl-CoA carboxylase alpha subunit
MAQRLRDAVVRNLVELEALPIDELLERRYRKHRAIGSVIEPAPAPV